MDLSALTNQLKTYVRDFSDNTVIWTFYENLIPYLILTPIVKTENGFTHKRDELKILNGATDVVIFDITRHQLEVISHRRGLPSQQDRFMRHVATMYHTFRIRLTDLYWKRLVLHNQREFLQIQRDILRSQREVQQSQRDFLQSQCEQTKAQKQQMEAIDGLVAQIMALRMTSKPVVAPPVSNSSHSSRIWHEWDNENDEKAFMADTTTPQSLAQSSIDARPRPLGPEVVPPYSSLSKPVLRATPIQHVGDQSYGSLSKTPIGANPPPLLVCGPSAACGQRSSACAQRSSACVSPTTLPPSTSFYSKPD